MTTLSEALARLRPEGMRPALAATRELLTIPSPEITALVREDPFRLRELLQERLGAQSALRVGASAQGYISGDGRRRLVIARPAQPPFNTTFSHALLDRLAVIKAEREASAAR